MNFTKKPLSLSLIFSSLFLVSACAVHHHHYGEPSSTILEESVEQSSEEASPSSWSDSEPVNSTIQHTGQAQDTPSPISSRPAAPQQPHTSQGSTDNINDFPPRGAMEDRLIGCPARTYNTGYITADCGNGYYLGIQTGASFRGDYIRTSDYGRSLVGKDYFLPVPRDNIGGTGSIDVAGSSYETMDIRMFVVGDRSQSAGHAIYAQIPLPGFGVVGVTCAGDEKSKAETYRVCADKMARLKEEGIERGGHPLSSNLSVLGYSIELDHDCFADWFNTIGCSDGGGYIAWHYEDSREAAQTRLEERLRSRIEYSQGYETYPCPDDGSTCYLVQDLNTMVIHARVIDNGPHQGVVVCDHGEDGFSDVCATFFDYSYIRPSSR